ncbi:MAG: hypothetical protein K0Q79_1692 [Flavipsychrobacter sp.]|nr:hypothetical protein [Flavipsychrobacter sp.]
MGLTGSLHCAGMCGPIMWIMPFQVYSGARKAIALGLYHLGRISVYAFMAVILYSFRGLFRPAIQQYVSIGMGIILLVVGIISFFSNYIHIKLPWEDFVKKQLGDVISKPGLSTIAVAGMLNGLLPCGLVYMALSVSVTAETVWQSAIMLYAFGLGTVPMLVSITLLKNRLSIFRATHIKKLVPVMVFLFGCLFLLRGLNLGIPYLSPKIAVTSQGIHSCCHKK